MANLGEVILEFARSTDTSAKVPEAKAQLIRDNLSNQISSKLEESRAAQRRALDETIEITIY